MDKTFILCKRFGQPALRRPYGLPVTPDRRPRAGRPRLRFTAGLTAGLTARDAHLIRANVQAGRYDQSNAGDRLLPLRLVPSTYLSFRSKETLTVEFSTRCAKLCGQRAVGEAELG